MGTYYIAPFFPADVDKDIQAKKIPYEIRILDENRKWLDVIEQFMTMSWTRRWQRPNSFDIEINRNSRHAKHIDEDHYIDVYRNGEPEYTGLIEHAEIQLTEQGKLSENWTVRGGDFINRRICLPPDQDTIEYTAFITVTRTADNSGDLEITINGILFTIDIVAGDTTEEIANKIQSEIDAHTNYDADKTQSDTVRIRSVTPTEELEIVSVDSETGIDTWTRVEEEAILSYDERDGAAETVLKGYVNLNLVNPDESSRKISELSIEPDAERGDNVAVRARFERLDEKIEEVSRSGMLGWEIIGYGEGVRLEIVEGIDKSTTQTEVSPIIFSPDFGNLRTLGYQWSKLTRNTLLYMGGEGEGAKRLLEKAFIGDEPEGLDRRENFFDGRDLDTEAKLTQRGRAILDSQGPKDRLEAEMLSKGPFRYRDDWDLGDIVTVRNLDWGVVAHLRITEIKITLTAKQPEQIEVSFGAPWPNFIKDLKQETEKPGPAMRE